MRSLSFIFHTFSAEVKECVEPELLDFESIFESPTFSLCSGFLTSLWNVFGCSSDITLYKISKPTQFMKKNLHYTNKVEKI